MLHEQHGQRGQQRHEERAGRQAGQGNQQQAASDGAKGAAGQVGGVERPDIVLDWFPEAPRLANAKRAATNAPTSASDEAVARSDAPPASPA